MHVRPRTDRAIRLLATLSLVLTLVLAALPPGVASAATTSRTYYYTGTLQSFVVPAGTSHVTIQAFGGRGGSNAGNGGGRAASMRGTFPVTPGESLRVLVGAAGATGDGGGGSFVWRGTGSASYYNLLIAAGGGGGAGSGSGGREASLGTSGLSGVSGCYSAGSGGSSGYGGYGAGGAGGAGLLGNGGNGFSAGVTLIGGRAISSGAASPTFGGGGDGYASTSRSAAGGGGGGYSGGGGGARSSFLCSGRGGGGGGSINRGQDQANMLSSHTGHGRVVITYQSDTTAPLVSPQTTGQLGQNGWYTSDVALTWSVTDDESAIRATSGCQPRTVASDTPGATYTCVATSLGGTGSGSVMVKRDATSPTIGASLSPPPNAAGWNNRDVTVGFACADGTAGVAACPAPARVSSEGAGSRVGQARYVRVQSNAVTGIALREVQVFAGGVNVAQGKTASQSTTWDPTGFNAGIAVDGQIPTDFPNGDYGSIALTHDEPNPWWQVDLGAPTVVERVVLFNRTYCCSEKLHDFDVLLSLDGVTWTSAYHQDEAAGASVVAAVTSAVDNAGNSATANVPPINVDKTPPTIQGAADRPANAHGWYNAPVGVAFECQDPVSGLTACGPNQVLSTQGADQSASGTASDRADNTASAVVGGINVDLTGPTLSGAPLASPNGNGWYNGDVTVRWTAVDDLSGITVPPADTVVSGEGSNLTATSSVADRADNTTTATAGPFRIDRTPPTTAAQAPSGWNNQSVTVGLSAGDTLSGVAATYYTLNGGPTQTGTNIAFSADGVHQLTFWSVDAAGNTEAPRTVQVKIDRTPPTITHGQSPAANAAGWNNSDVTVTFTCHDALSQIATCTQPQTVTSEGAAQPVTGTATDHAGNTATDPATVSIDKTAPTIAAAQAPEPNAAGWNNQDVVVTFLCADQPGLSGVAACAPPQTLGEGMDQTATGQAADGAGNSASTSLTGINVDKTLPTISGEADRAANESGWYNAPVTVTFACADELSQVESCSQPVTLATDGDSHAAAGTAVDKAGNRADALVGGIKIDQAAPTIAGATTAKPNAAGWFSDDVTVRFECADALSGVAACTPDQTVTSEGQALSVPGQATDQAGNTAQATVSGINLDKSAPTIGGAADRAANDSGWYNAPVTVSFACADQANLSGIAACTAPVTLEGEGADQVVSGTATDAAGNSASTTVGPIKLDLTPPTVVGAATAQPNASGWYRGDVVVRWTAEDGLSGVDQPADTVVTGEGAALSATVEVADRADNRATGTAGPFSIDRTAPSTTVNTPTDWQSKAVAVLFEASDALSGVAETRFAVDDGEVQVGNELVLSEEGIYTIRYWSVDAAGNAEAPNQVVVRIDLTAPTINHILSPLANALGWNNAAVTVTWTCYDDLSGVASCSDPQTVETEGEAQTLTGTGTNHAGLSASDVVTLNIDLTAPTISGKATTSPNASGWYRAPVTVAFECADALSKVGSCAEAQTLSQDGADQSATGAAADNADNTAAATVTGINIDQAAPTISGAVDRAANESGWYSAPVTVSFACADALSGIAACTAPAVLAGEGASQAATGEATDRAGNTAAATVSGISLDLTAPTISGVLSRAANGYGWYDAPVTVAFTCGDNLSGVASCAEDQTVGEGAAQSVTGAASDKAGNGASATIAGINVDTTKPTVAYVGNAGNYTVDQQVTITCAVADDLSGVASTTCQAITGPAYSFLLGTNSYSATATDRAGHVSPAATATFTVTADVASVNAVIERLVGDEAVASSLQSQVESIGAATTSKAKAGKLAGFTNHVKAQTGKSISSTDAAILLKLASGL